MNTFSRKCHNILCSMFSGRFFVSNLNLKNLFINLAIPLSVGFISSFLTKDSMNMYKNVNQPEFAPPSTIFPVVWTILYILMGISSYIVVESDSNLKGKSIFVYYMQLIVNFFWPIIFFNLRMYLFAFFWLLLLWILTFYMIILFKKINKLSSYIQIPYLLWLTFASFLNFSVYLLN